MLTEQDILKLPRREVRYHLYRIRTYVEGGSSHRAEPFKEYFESREGFTNWNGFARTWDLDVEGSHHEIVKRKFTEEQEWNYQINSLVEELPRLKK